MCCCKNNCHDSFKQSITGHAWVPLHPLTHWGRDKMAAISQTTLSNNFFRMKMFEFRLRFLWNLFPRPQLTIFHHCCRWWLGAGQATSHYLKQWWLIYRRIYASSGLNELTHLPLVPHTCIWVRESGQLWFRYWLGTYLAPSHYLNQWWNIVNWTLRNKLQWNFNQNTKLFIHEDASENIFCTKAFIHEDASVNIVCEMATILSRLRWV